MGTPGGRLLCGRFKAPPCARQADGQGVVAGYPLSSCGHNPAAHACDAASRLRHCRDTCRPARPRPLLRCPWRRQAVAQLVRSEKWADAVSMLLRFAASCDGMGARNSQCKAYLGAVVVWLYAGKGNDAWVTYQARLRAGGPKPCACVQRAPLQACRLRASRPRACRSPLGVLCCFRAVHKCARGLLACCLGHTLLRPGPAGCARGGRVCQERRGVRGRCAV